MQLKPNLVERIGYVDKRFNQLREKFSVFLTNLDYFAEPKCHIPGVKVTKAADGLSCSVAFATVVIEDRFLVSMRKDGSGPTGHVICTLEAPLFMEEVPLLGSFTFKGKGTTDFEPPANADPIEIDTHAAELVMHFVELALQRPMPTT